MKVSYQAEKYWPNESDKTPILTKSSTKKVKIVKLSVILVIVKIVLLMIQPNNIKLDINKHYIIFQVKNILV